MNNPHLIYLALGTNLGNRENNLIEAIQTLPPQVTVLAVSRLFETAPAYVLNQPSFFNIVLKGQTALSPTRLLTYLKGIEQEIGREKTVRYGPRKIDLDILFYDNLVLNIPDLHIPHLRMLERGFVMRPLADIAAEMIHPILKQTVAKLLLDLPPDDGILAIHDWQPPT